jgi:glycyl-tRNA synthetase beta chain
MTATLLLEIGTEELPPKALPRLSDAFADGVEAALRGAGFTFAEVTAYATPRRLALSIANLAERQPDRVETRRGPAVNAAFDAAGNPTKAALGFARSCGVEVTELTRLATADGEWLAYEAHRTGRSITVLIGEFANTALAALPIPKRMRWGTGDIEFVRPVHWVVAIYGTELIDCEILGIASGRTTRGHRFHHGGEIVLGHADEYAARLLAEGHVMASFAARRARVAELVTGYGSAGGGSAVMDEDLLDEVTALVEWPVVLGGSFDATFLTLPEEALIASMQGHQKYFPVRGADGRLCNRFIAISNIDSADPSVVIAGNERVIRPRLADADFFYRTDRTQPLDSRLDALSGMLFEKRLGSLRDKTERVERLALRLAPSCRAEPGNVGRAARLARCDLVSAMVGEFPELQGTIGRYYALADGEATDVATAIGEFYRPRFAGDDIPASPTGRCIALADKLDTLVGIFGIGLAPTGDKDPYALRRAALGVLRILIEGDIELDLRSSIEVARAIYGDLALAADTAAQVYAFMRERLRGYYLERNIASDVCAAVFANDPGSPREVARRIAAVAEFRELDQAGALAAANKRIGNILKKLDVPVTGVWDRALLSEDAEQALAAALEHIGGELERSFEQREYAAYLTALAGLRAPVDRFFEEVMVMCEDDAQRHNRLALLAHLQSLLKRIADISYLHEA